MGKGNNAPSQWRASCPNRFPGNLQAGFEPRNLRRSRERLVLPKLPAAVVLNVSGAAANPGCGSTLASVRGTRVKLAEAGRMRWDGSLSFSY